MFSFDAKNLSQSIFISSYELLFSFFLISLAEWFSFRSCLRAQFHWFTYYCAWLGECVKNKKTEYLQFSFSSDWVCFFAFMRIWWYDVCVRSRLKVEHIKSVVGVEVSNRLKNTEMKNRNMCVLSLLFISQPRKTL